MNSIHKKNLLATVEKLHDFNVNVMKNEELAKYYAIWVEQVKIEKITDPKLAKFIHIQMDYWQPKDRAYVEYLDKLLKNS